MSKRHYYPGSNHGRHWGMLILDPVSKCLQVPHGKKKLYYGPSMRPGGGPPDDEQIDAPDGSPGETITANTMVPFCWRSYPLRFSQDMVKSFNATHILDFTPGSGGLVVALLLEGSGVTQYVGICHTQEHIDLLKKHLTQQVMGFMSDESCKLYNPLYAKFLKGDGQSGNPPGSSTAGGSKTQGKAKTSGKRKRDPEPDDGAVTDDASGDGKESCDNESSAPPSEGEP